MILPLKFSLLLPAELAEASRNYRALFAETESPDPFVEKVTAQMIIGENQINEALAAIRVNSQIVLLQNLDAARDDLYIALKNGIDIARRRKGEALLQAHALLWPVIEKLGVDLYTLSYSEESGKLVALFEILDRAEYQAALQAVNVSDIYAELKEAQAEFAAVYSQRLEEDARKNYPTLQEAKQSVIPMIQAFLSVMQVLERTTPAISAALVSKVNEITSNYTALGRARKSRKQNGEAPAAPEQ